MRSLTRLRSFLSRHENQLWWLHSAYALILGIGAMWLGARHFTLLRLVVIYIAFIWVTSLIVLGLVDQPDASSRWRRRVRLVLNYFNKNFYQQLLFFLLPVYWASTTAWSRNMPFVVFLAASAVLSTLDVVYDRHLSVRRGLAAVFFAFNLFACINAMLPTVWSISDRAALPVSAVLALVAFVTVRYPPHEWRRRRVRVVLVASALVLLAAVEWGAPFIPPVPLRLARVEIGGGINRRALRVTSPLAELVPGWSGRLYAVTAIRAPLGLEDKVRHRWFHNGREVFASAFYRVQGGRAEGFRLWTSHMFRPLPPGATVRLDVETEAGQLIGRAWLRVGP